MPAALAVPDAAEMDRDVSCALPEPMPDDIVERLAAFEVFGEVDRAAIEWFVSKATCTRYAQYAAIARPGQAVTAMGVIVTGRLKFLSETNKGYQDMGDSSVGETYGKLPFSRMTHATGMVRVEEEALLIELEQEHFTEMVQVSYRLVQNLVAMMSDRIREFSDFRAQDEKMMSFG